jgi:hypothetical protein
MSTRCNTQSVLILKDGAKALVWKEGSARAPDFTCISRGAPMWRNVH